MKSTDTPHLIQHIEVFESKGEIAIETRPPNDLPLYTNLKPHVGESFEGSNPLQSVYIEDNSYVNHDDRHVSRKVLYPGFWWQFTSRDRVLWNNLLLHNITLHLGEGATFARANDGSLSDEYFQNTHYHLVYVQRLTAKRPLPRFNPTPTDPNKAA